jgi:hypothetical protein
MRLASAREVEWFVIGPPKTVAFFESRNRRDCVNYRWLPI